MYYRTFLRHAFCRDKSCMVFDNLFANGKADARSFVLVPGMQALEDVKYFMTVGRSKPNSVVGKGEMVIEGICPGVFIGYHAAIDDIGGYNNMRCNALLGIFECIAYNICKQLLKLDRDYIEPGQRAGFN